MSLNHESKALQSRLDTEQNAIKRMEAVQALVDRFPSGEMAPGEGPTLEVSTHSSSLITRLCDIQNMIMREFSLYNRSICFLSSQCFM